MTPFVVCFACKERGTMTRAAVEAVQRPEGWAWKLPPRWSWIPEKGGVCPNERRSSVAINDGAVCVCGSMMQRTGNCYTCPNCAANGGCG